MTNDGQHIRKGIIFFLEKKQEKQNFFERILYPLSKSSVISVILMFPNQRQKKTLTQKNKKIEVSLGYHTTCNNRLF